MNTERFFMVHSALILFILIKLKICFFYFEMYLKIQLIGLAVKFKLIGMFIVIAILTTRQLNLKS